MDKKELLKQADSLRNEISKQIHNHTFICSTMKDQLKEQNDKLDEHIILNEKLFEEKTLLDQHNHQLKTKNIDLTNEIQQLNLFFLEIK
jgi:hypothetical protein